MTTEPQSKPAQAATYTYESPGYLAARQRTERAIIMAALRAGASSREALAALDGQGGGPANEEDAAQGDQEG